MSNRTRTRERRKQREKQRQRNRQILILGSVVVIAVVVVVLMILANQPAEAPIPQELLDRYQGIPQSMNDQGFPLLGNPDAPVQVVEYSSFDCPHCAEFEAGVTPALVDRVKAGDINFTYAPLYGTGGIQNGQGAAKAALCAGEQNAFWAYHSAIFSWQSLYGNQALAGNRLESGISTLGLNVSDWNSCFNSSRINDTLQAANDAALAIPGFTGTPTVTVNGSMVTDANGTSSPILSDINAAIDAALAG